MILLGCYVGVVWRHLWITHFLGELQKNNRHSFAILMMQVVRCVYHISKELSETMLPPPIGPPKTNYVFLLNKNQGTQADLTGRWDPVSSFVVLPFALALRCSGHTCRARVDPGEETCMKGPGRERWPGRYHTQPPQKWRNVPWKETIQKEGIVFIFRGKLLLYVFVFRRKLLN